MNGFKLLEMTVCGDRLGITADQDSIIARARRFMELAGTETLPVTLTAMGIQFRIIDGAWFPLFSEEDIARLAQPGTLSNVVNGIRAIRLDGIVPRRMGGRTATRHPSWLSNHDCAGSLKPHSNDFHSDQSSGNKEASIPGMIRSAFL